MNWFITIILGILPLMEFGVWMGSGITLPITLFWCFITAGVGFWFSRTEKLNLWTELESDIQNNRVPTSEGLDTMLTVLGGWGLIIPGLLSDFIGFALVVPQVRLYIEEPIKKLLRDYISGTAKKKE